MSYQPKIPRKASGVPVLSRKAIDQIAQEYLKDFSPAVLTEPQPVDVEKFIEFYLNLNSDTSRLSIDGNILGMMVFRNSAVPVFNEETKRAEFRYVQGNTVLVEEKLLTDERQKGRYRFTLGHEAGHKVFHADCVGVEKGVVVCRKDQIGTNFRTQRTWDDHQWMEWQANAFASCLLLPEPAVRQIAGNTIRDMNNKLDCSIGVIALSSTFDVSEKAAEIRLKDLGLIPLSYHTELGDIELARNFKYAIWHAQKQKRTKP